MTYGYNKDILRQHVPLGPPQTPETEAKARRTVCGNSDSADEARIFLSMLGILPEGSP